MPLDFRTCQTSLSRCNDKKLFFFLKRHALITGRRKVQFISQSELENGLHILIHLIIYCYDILSAGNKTMAPAPFAASLRVDEFIAIIPGLIFLRRVKAFKNNNAYIYIYRFSRFAYYIMHCTSTAYLNVDILLDGCAYFI